MNELNFIRKAITHIEEPEDKWLKEVIMIGNKLNDLQRRLSGDPLRSTLDMDPTPSVSDRIGRIIGEGKYSSSEPTGTHLKSYEIARDELALILPELQQVLEKDLPDLRRRLRDAGAPYTPNVIPSLNKQ